LFILLFSLALFGLAQTAEDHLKKGDDYYTQLDNQKALEEFLAANKLDPNNYEALWKLSRTYIDLGDLVSPKEKDYEAQQKQLYKNAQSYARKAVIANPNDTWGHFYLSASLGMYALMLGKKDQINMSKEIKTAIDKAIQLDPNNDLAYHALGRWQRRMAEIGGAQRLFGSIIFGSIPKGSFEASETALKKAVELKPDYINHRLELGRTYVSLKKYDLAAQEFQKCLDLNLASSKDQAYKDEAGQELAAAKKKIK
jgi:tetratricopeptide (TPR) repeat protein